MGPYFEANPVPPKFNYIHMLNGFYVYQGAVVKHSTVGKIGFREVDNREEYKIQKVVVTPLGNEPDVKKYF